MKNLGLAISFINIAWDIATTIPEGILMFYILNGVWVLQEKKNKLRIRGT